MNESLYSINSDLKLLLDECRSYAENHEGELLPELAERLESLEIAYSDKLESCLGYYHSEAAMADAISREADRLDERAARHAGNARWIKEYLGQIVAPGQKHEFAVGRISWRASESVDVSDVSLLPADCLRVIPENKEPDKKAIKDKIASGVEVPGATIVKTNNIQIK